MCQKYIYFQTTCAYQQPQGSQDVFKSDALNDALDLSAKDDNVWAVRKGILCFALLQTASLGSWLYCFMDLKTFLLWV